MHLPFSAIGVVVLLNAAASASPALTADDKNTAILAARQVADTTTAKKACTNRIVQQKLHALCRLTLTQYAFMGCDYSKGPLPGFLKGALAPYSNQVIVEACAAALGTTVPVCGLPSPSSFKYCMSRHCDCTQSTDKRTITCHYYTSITKRSDETFNEAIFDVFNVPPYSPGGTLYIEAAGGSSGSASGALLYGSFANTRSGQVKLAVGATVRNSRIGAGPDGGSGSTASNSFDTVKMPAAIGGGGSTTIDCKSVNGAGCYVVAAGAGGSGQSYDSDGTTILESPGTDADSAPDDTYLENGRRGGSGAPGQGSGGGGGGYRGGRAGSSQRGGSSSGGRGGRTGGTGGRSFGPSSVTKDLCAYPSTSGAKFGARCGEAYVSYSI